MVETHPIQVMDRAGKVNIKVSLAAYEVYSKIFAPQPKLITGNCRGGFGAGELVALLYARSFPQEEWAVRFDEALEGMVNL